MSPLQAVPKISRGSRAFRRIFAHSPAGPRHVRTARELYRYRSASQWLFTLVERVLLNLGNWTTSVGLGLRTGYLTFDGSRGKFRAEAKLRPPLGVTQSRANDDRIRLMAEGLIVWEE